jgi:hypothetical protein
VSNAEYSQLILDESEALVEYVKDRRNPDKHSQWDNLYQRLRKERRNRQDQSYAAQYPAVQFDRQPDEGLL